MRFKFCIFSVLGKFVKVYSQKFLFANSTAKCSIIPVFRCDHGVVEVLFG